MRGLQRRLAAQLRTGPIRHPVAMHDHVLHQSISSSFRIRSASGSTTTVLLRFFNAVSGSFKPCPVRVQTTVEPGLSLPVAPYLIAPATEAAEAGSAKIPCSAIRR